MHLFLESSIESTKITKMKAPIKKKRKEKKNLIQINRKKL